MSSFDIDSYLKSRTDADNKLAQLEEASANKRAALSAFRSAVEPPATAWADQLGLDKGGFAANRVNDLASVVSGASRMAGQVAALPTNIAGIVATDAVNAGDIDAYNRAKLGTAQPEDLARLDRLPEPGFPSVLERIEFANKQRVTSQATTKAFNLDGIVEQSNRQALSADLKKGFQPAFDQAKSGWDNGKPMDVVSGVASLLTNAGSAILTNPSAVREYVLENAPQLFVGMLGKAGQAAMAASNVGYAADTFQAGVTNYVKANSGQLPPEELLRDMALKSASLALAEHASDVVGLGATKAAAAFAKDAVKGTADMTRAGFKDSLLNVGKATATGIASEAPTEGYQTWAEGQITGKPATAQEIYDGAVIGGASGGSLSGGGRAVAEALAPAPESAAAIQEKVNAASTKALVDEAIKTGDVSSLLDAPQRAIGALIGNSQLADTTPAQKQANLVKADEILASMDTARAEAQSVLEKTTVAGTQKAIDARKAQLAGLDAADPANAPKVAALTSMIEMLGEQLTGLQADPKAAEADARIAQANLSKVERDLKKATETYGLLKNLVNPATEVAEPGIDNKPVEQLTADDVAQMVRAADTDTSPEKEAVSKVITLAMRSPESLDATQVANLVNNASNGLSTEQRTFLRVLSEARLAQNALRTMDMVSSEVMNGSADNKGIVTYAKEIGEALVTGNTKKASRSMEGLQAFAVTHASKAAAAQEALATGPGTQIVRSVDGVWSIPATPLTPEALKANGGLSMDTPKLVEAIKAESAALNKTVEGMEAAFVIAGKKGSGNVTNQPQQAAGSAKTQVAPATPAQASTPAAVPAPVGGTVPGAVPGTGNSAGQPVSPAAPAPVIDPTQQTVATAVDEQTTTDTVEGSKESKDSITADNSTAKNTESTESAEQTSEDTTETGEESSKAVLSAFDDVAPNVTEPYLINQIAKYWKQTAKAAGDVVGRPLATVKDFFTAQKEGRVAVTDFLADKTMDQKAIASFFRVAPEWMADIQANLPKKFADEFRHQDMMRFFLKDTDKGVDLDENVKLAIAYAAWSYVAEESTKPWKLKDKAINAILHHRKDAHVLPNIRSKLNTIGTYDHLVYDSVGGKVLDALGLSATKEASQEQQPRLRAALGVQVIMLLEREGLVSRTKIPEADMLEMQLAGLSEKDQTAVLRKRGEVSSFAYHSFITMARDKEGVVPVNARKIVAATRGSKGVLDKLFKVAGAVRFPSLEPINSVQKTTSGTKMGVPNELKDVLIKNQNNPRLVRKDMFAVSALFDKQEFLELLGVEPVDESTTHAVNLPGLEAKNQGLEREWDLFTEFVGEYLRGSEKKLDTPFFLEFDVWKQQRVGISTNAVNPQTSKIVRHFIGSPDWKATISSEDTEAMTSFYLRVAEGLGTKTEKAVNEAQLDGIIDMLKQPVYADAIAALRKAAIRQEELTAEEKDAIKAGVAEGGENTHSLDALMAMAYQQEAEAGGAPYTFETQIMGEVDGVANGTMLNHILLGAGYTTEALMARLNQGGFFEQGSPYTHYSQYRGTQGNMDVYESTALMLHKRMQLMLNNLKGTATAAQIASIWAISGELFSEQKGVTKDGRNLVKGALNPLAFGSSMDRIKEGMADTFIESIYAGFEKLAKKEKVTQAEVDAYVANVNTLIDRQGFKIQAGQPISWHMTRPLHPGAVSYIQAVFTNTVGEATVGVVEEEFGAFLEQRDTLNNVAQATHSLYDAVYSGMREEYVNLLASKGQLPTDKKGKVIGDLNSVQEAEFQKVLAGIEPILQTAMSKKDKGVKTGLRMAKTKRKQSTDSKYFNKVEFGAKQGLGEKSIGASGMATTSDSPGVAMGSASTHSFDSGISHRTQAAMDVLNVHDAVGAGVLGLKQAARLMNQNTWEGLLEYSPMEEVYQSLSNVVAGISDLAQKNALSPQAVKNLQQVLKQIAKDTKSSPDTALESLLQTAKSSAYNADKTKFAVLAQLAYLDQYAYEGGQYEVTEQDRTKVADMAAALTGALSQQDAVSLKALKNIATVKPGAKTTTTEAVPAAVEAQAVEESPGDEFDLDDEAPAMPPSSPYGKLGKPGIAADKDLEAFFKEYPETTAKRVMRMLHNRSWDDKAMPNQAFMKSLLSALYKVIDPAMPVRYITANTPADAVLEVPENASRGWYSVNGTAEEINVLSPEFVASGLTPELLVHELVHSALLQAMRSGNPEVQPFIDSLNKLMGKAESYAKTNGLFEKHKAAFENLDEFVTWGMTNPEFQKEVLSQFYMKPADGTKTLVTALQDFIKNITNILFLQFRKADGKGLRPSVGKNVNGMAILINDVMQVMEKAAKNRQSGVTATVSMASRINDYSTQDIHRALDDGKISHGFQDHLSNLLGNVTAKLHGPFGAFLESLKSGQAISPMDVWTKALDTGVAPFASKILGSGFVVSQQEAFAIEQVEATVRAALDGNEANTKFAYKELATLYMEAKRKLPVEKFHAGDWATATQTERDNAQALHDFVFALEKGNGDRMDYLSRFAALGLAHEGFNKLLQMSTDVEQGRVSKAKGLANKLQAVFESILEFFSSKITHTYGGQRADSKLTALVSTLVDIEAKKRHRLAMDAAKAAKGPTSSIVDKATDGARNAVVGVLNSSFIKKSSFRLVRGAGAVGRMVAEDRVAQFMEAVGDLRDKMNEGRPGLVGGVFNVVRGPKETMEAMVRMAKGYEGHRKDVITAATKAVAQSFNKALNREQKASITRVFLRTGAHALVDQMGLTDMEKLLSNPKALASAITRAENVLSAFPQYQHYFKAQANALAYAKVGRDAGGFTMMNAHNIAFMAGTVHKGKLSGNDLKQATKAIETLVALYAIDYSPSVDRNLVSELMRDELQRTDGGNGVEFTLKLHKRLEQDSRERLFQGQEALMMHGFTSEILNPHVEVITAYVADEKDLLDQGYVRVGPLEYDAADPDTDAKAMYVLKDGGLSPYQSGAISISSKKAKGSKKHSGYLNVNHADGAMNASTNAEIMNTKQAEIAAMFKPAPRKNMAAVKGAKLTPVLNAQGDVVNWRYLMSEKNKDTLLDRTNNFDSILGAIAGSIYDKSTTQEQNSKVLQTLKEVYDADVARNPDSFINVGPKSKDKEMAEIWDMLPKETKATAISVFGLGGIQVRKDAVDMTFGYRKASLASLFDKENRKLLEDLFVNTVEGLLTLYAYAKGKRGQEAQDYAKRAAMVVTKSERMWQSLVQETKDIVVVKTGTVLLGNIWSNLSLLVLKGVPLKDMVHHHSVALRGATSYMGDTEELDRLRLLIQSDYAGTEPGGKKGIEERILVLEDAIARNPVRELIEAGLMPSIVEDVAAEEDPYSYKSLLVRKMESATSGVPQPLVNAAKTVYMSKDGAMYKALYRTTQLSDFVARYTLYQHLISREKNPMSKEAALFEASESFVNYDLPMPKTLQYMDDMGIMPFMKYFLNIQRVIQKTAKENPVRVLSAIALGNVMDLGPIVLSSAAITRIGNNPVDAGAIKFFGSLDDLATTNAAISLIK